MTFRALGLSEAGFAGLERLAGFSRAPSLSSRVAEPLILNLSKDVAISMVEERSFVNESANPASGAWSQ